MEGKYYTNERSLLILIALLKAHGIKKVIASPGTTNLTFVASLQQDSWFEIYSAADERSAAYMAIGLCEESGEPVVISCTGATASRNYMSGLTEAYYRKLPILAITSTQNPDKIGLYNSQVIDRRVLPNDIANLSVDVRAVRNEEDAVYCQLKVNKAITELKRRGGGPVHINLQTLYSRDFSVKELPKVRVIQRFRLEDELPKLPDGSKISIYVASHSKWSERLTTAVDRFCAVYNAIVLCDHTSNYNGEYKILTPLVSQQEQYDTGIKESDVLIYIGGVSGAEIFPVGKQMWRVNEDGEFRNQGLPGLKYIFEMSECAFFEHYVKEGNVEFLGEKRIDYYRSIYKNLYSSIISDKLPFSNIWAAYRIAPLVPQNSIIHLGIVNSLRAWNFFEIPHTVTAYSNVGGYGIDGCMSSLIGASLVHKDRLYFGVFGDLSFFYDMNSLGNRHVGDNLRILLVNNGDGTEFRHYCHMGSDFDDKYANKYFAAGGHYGNKSRVLVKHFAKDLGFEYLSASNKDEFEEVLGKFVQPEVSKSIIFEIFTDNYSESKSLKMIRNLQTNLKGKLRNAVRQYVPMEVKQVLKGVLGKE